MSISFLLVVVAIIWENLGMILGEYKYLFNNRAYYGIVASPT